MKAIFNEFMNSRFKRLVAAAVLILLSAVLMSGIYQKWIPRKGKRNGRRRLPNWINTWKRNTERKKNSFIVLFVVLIVLYLLYEK